jgi:dihydrofolate synthase/folylpolyglutamate synthase
LSVSSQIILERFRTSYGKDIDLTLRPGYRDLLARLGDPHLKLPPVFHVAGTNGKGSTCAFMRAMLEAAGKRVHVYTSPHLVTFHERIRIAGNLISEAELTEILAECERAAAPGAVSYFEAATAAAFVAFARYPADYTILEVGLGGRLDATNIVDQKLATVITRLSFDHREYLGETLKQIAGEKAGIMRPGVPCFAAAQREAEVLQALRDRAGEIGASLMIAGMDWHIKKDADGFHFTDKTRAFDLPAPALVGDHQYDNAGLAIAALSVLPQPLSSDAIAAGLRTVDWPGRLQRLTTGPLAAMLGDKDELWLDGGHNDSAGQALAAQIERWRREDGAHPKTLHVIVGMINTKKPEEFLRPFAPLIAGLHAVAVPNEPSSLMSADIARAGRALGIKDVSEAESVPLGLQQALAAQGDARRVLVCGSLYLVGATLASYG